MLRHRAPRPPRTTALSAIAAEFGTVRNVPLPKIEQLIAGPPKTRAGRRTVGLPPLVVRELEAHLAAAQHPCSHVFTAAGGAAAGPGLWGTGYKAATSRSPGRSGRAVPSSKGLNYGARQQGRKP